MSKVQLAGNANGTGIFTIASPNSNTDRTLTLPDNTGTLLSSASSVTQNAGPAFSAYNSGSQSCPTSTNTLSQFATERFDTDSCFNNTGSTVGGIPAYAFLPNVAGYYIVSAGMQYQGTGYAGYFVYTIYKNGSSYGETVQTSSVQYIWSYYSNVIYLNGTTDYIQMYYNQLQGSSQNCSGNFSAALVRKA